MKFANYLVNLWCKDNHKQLFAKSLTYDSSSDILGKCLLLIPAQTWCVYRTYWFDNRYQISQITVVILTASWLYLLLEFFWLCLFYRILLFILATYYVSRTWFSTFSKYSKTKIKFNCKKKEGTENTQQRMKLCNWGSMW